MPYRNRSQLIQAGQRPRFLYFWGHTPRSPDQVDASCFSQWFDDAFRVDGVVYATAEHFMMAEKARFFGDEIRRQQILASSTPGQAKALGRMVSGFEQQPWDQACWHIVVQGNLAKFSQSPEMKAFLLATRGRVLVEASPHDRIWGIGLHRDDPRSADPQQWLGDNLLGFALMEVRDLLNGRSGSAPDGVRRSE